MLEHVFEAQVVAKVRTVRVPSLYSAGRLSRGTEVEFEVSAKSRRKRHPAGRSGHVVKNPNRVIDLADEVSESTQKFLAVTRSVTQVAMGAVFVAGIVLALRFGVTPLAEAIAGTSTEVSVNAGIATSVGLNISFALALSLREWSRRELVREINELERKRKKQRRRR